MVIAQGIAKRKLAGSDNQRSLEEVMLFVFINTSLFNNEATEVFIQHV